MPQFSGESDVAEDAATWQQPEEAVADAGTLALSADEFAALEERIRRVVDQIKQERQARAAADERAARAEAQLREQEPLLARLQKENDGLRAERDHVRQRVERLLAQLDALEL